jgi:hypothetical protein
MPAAALQLILAGLLVSLFPAQAKQIASQASQAKAAPPSGMSLETGEACSGLSDEECCGQKLEMAQLRSQGDYLPRTIKTTVHLACMDAHKTVTPQVCKSITISRGFAPKEAESICKPAQRECQKDGTCRECVSELVKLDYQGSHNVCRALTYIPSHGPRVVVIRNEAAGGDESTRFEITRKRTHVR